MNLAHALRRRTGALAAALLIGTTALTACTASSDGGGSADGAASQPPAAETLNVLAGSEVKDMEPVLDDMAEATGVHLNLTYTGTLDGTELVAQGGAAGKYDATWFPSNKYLNLLPGGAGSLSAQNKIMYSPVVLGVKPSVAAGLGWDKKAPTWADIVTAVQGGRFRYGITSPVSSNSGFSALIEAATALSDTGDALTSAQVDKVADKLVALSAGQTLTSGSSGWLATKFADSSDQADGIFNYSSVLEETPIDGKPLTIVIPSDGVITADYPLSLLASADPSKKDLYDQAVAYLTKSDVQKKIADTTHRNTTADPVNDNAVFELPFPADLRVVKDLIDTYLTKVKKPSDMVFALDTSGSMDGSRIEALKKSMAQLTNADPDNSFIALHDREKVTVIEFADQVKDTTTFAFTSADLTSEYGRLRKQVDGMRAKGGTAIYTTLKDAYRTALAEKDANPDSFISVVLLTDGENTDGITEDEFQTWYAGQTRGDSGIQTIPLYTISFGDADTGSLNAIAELTGGKGFSADEATLSSTFKDIRGYQ
jgi:Ca-activated chloride channel homolog